MRLYDISVPLSSRTPTYPGDPGIEVREWLSLANGDPANVSVLHFGAHSGTHIDAPAHFIAGAPRIESLSLENLLGEALVVRVPDEANAIDAEFVRANVPSDTHRVLFKTSNSKFWEDAQEAFQEHYVYLTDDGAEELTRKGVALVGIDYLSIEKFQSPDFKTHHALLSRGVVILEGLNLSQVAPGRYELICLPLKISDGGGDGAPARAVLRELGS